MPIITAIHYRPISCAVLMLGLGFGIESFTFAAGNPTQGASVFDTECSDCHSVTAGKNKKGPSLFGVVGRTPATIENFKYSDAMRANHTTWSAEQLDAYITAPKRVVPGGKMKYDGLANATERADLIAYLSGLR